MKNNLNNNNIINKTKIYNYGKYIGEFKNDLRDGKGIVYYNSGSRYEGDWKNNKMEGKGIYYYNDGNRYEGDWKNDKKEGKGIYYFNNNDREMGDYQNGKPIRKHAKLHYNGEVTSKIYD